MKKWIFLVIIVIALLLIPKPYSFKEGDNCTPWNWHKDNGWCVGAIYPVYKDNAINCDSKSIAAQNHINDTREFKKGFDCVGIELFKSGIAIN